MAKKVYAGVGGTARKVKRGYAGVNNIARKIKRGYVGIGGVARPFWAGGETIYYGKLTNLTMSGSYTPTGASNPQYIVIAGTRNPTLNTYGGRDIEAYDVVTFTHYYRGNAFSQTRYHSKAAEVGDYAVFGGSEKTTADSPNLKTYGVNSNLTVLNGPDVSVLPTGSASLPSYAMFYENKTIEVYDGNLTKSSINMPGISSNIIASNAACQGINDKIIIKLLTLQQSGSTASPSNQVYALNENLTVSYINTEPVSRAQITSCANSKYAIFAGGVVSFGSSIYSDYVSAYDRNLTMATPAALSTFRDAYAPISLQENAGIAGGYYQSTYFNSVILYSTSLVQDTSKYQLMANRYLTTGVSDRKKNLSLVLGGRSYPSVTNEDKLVEAFIE